jgi:copper oxidase (laccase) domain-containing protein
VRRRPRAGQAGQPRQLTVTDGAPAWLRRPPGPLRDWRCGWTTVAGPDFSPSPDSLEQASACASLAAAVGLAGVAWARQVHGGDVLRAGRPGCVGDADALWTDRPGLGVVGRSADCPLILVRGAGPGGGLWGMAHASWRSTVAGVTEALLRAMTAAGLDAATAEACICPSAGPCCYEVGDEVLAAATAARGGEAAAHFRRRGDRWLYDLWGANTEQLLAAGLPARNIGAAGVCTICGGDDYPSYRRQGAAAGRIAAVSGG